MSSFNATVTPQHTSAGQSGDHDSDCLPVIGLFPRTNLPNPEIPDIAAMSDGERRLWLASRRDPVVDQLPQARRTPDGFPLGDLQPGTQRKLAACVGAARSAPESVAPAGGAIFSSCSDKGPNTTVAASTVGLDDALRNDMNDENDMEIDTGEDEAEVEAVEALLTLQRLKLSGRLSASKQFALAKPLGLVVQRRVCREVYQCVTLTVMVK